MSNYSLIAVGFLAGICFTVFVLMIALELRHARRMQETDNVNPLNLN
jgi:hypothetical protein